MVAGLALRSKHQQVAVMSNTIGVPASGADITMRSIDIWRFENDLFVEHWDELNLLEVFQQIGAIPMQPGAAQ